MELKLLAEVGIIGLPNAGKSTLISVVSAARPKIADYPFTTLVPNLGVVRRPSGDGTVFADIPGLIAGAARGAGLGHEFLRHIERTRLLIHLVDAASDTVADDVRVVMRELQAYGHGLVERPRLLVLNKIELLNSETLSSLVEELEAQTGEPVLAVIGGHLGPSQHDAGGGVAAVGHCQLSAAPPPLLPGQEPGLLSRRRRGTRGPRGSGRRRPPGAGVMAVFGVVSLEFLEPLSSFSRWRTLPASPAARAASISL